MSKNPKEIFETAATVGLGTRGFTPRAMAVVLQGVKQTIDELRNGSENNSHTVDCNTPYSLVVGEVDSNKLTKSKANGVEAAQILETVSLIDKKGNDLGNVRFESGNGIGVALSTRHNDTIYIHGGQLQTAIEKNSDDISGLLEQIKALQDEVATLKNIKVTKKNESVTKRKGTT